MPPLRHEPWGDEYVACGKCLSEVRTEDMERVNGYLMCEACAAEYEPAPEPMFEACGVEEVPARVRRRYAGVAA